MMNKLMTVIGMAAIAGTVAAPNMAAGATTKAAAPTAVVAESTQQTGTVSGQNTAATGTDNKDTTAVRDNGKGENETAETSENETDETAEKNEKEDSDKELSQDALKQQAKIDEATAIQTAKDAIGADKVADIKVEKLDMDNNKVVYELKGKDTSGQQIEVTIDAVDGSVTEKEIGNTESDAEEKDSSGNDTAENE